MSTGDSNSVSSVKIAEFIPNTNNLEVDSKNKARDPLALYSQVFFEAAQRISSSLSTNEVLNAIVENTARTTNCKGCSFLLLSPDKKQLVHLATYGLSDWYVKKGTLSADKSLSAALKGKPVLAYDAADDKHVQYRREKVREGIASILAVPVILESEIIGMMRLYTAEPRQFSEGEISFVEGVASLGALALQKARLHEAVSQDLQQCNVDLSRLESERQNLFHFLSMTTHDLKAPLSAVQTYFGVLLGGYSGKMTQKQKNIIERCSTRITELLELISDILDISKVAAGQLVREMEEVDLAAIVETSVETGRALAEKNGIELEVYIPNKLPVLHGARSRLQQVLNHLLSNAVTYTKPGGSVTLKIVNSRRVIRVEVTDNGIGIPKEEIGQVFEDYFHASNNVEKKGSGLGLAIAKRVVEAHGGKIWVESPCGETGRGCKFTFTIPKQVAAYSSGDGSQAK